MTFELFTSATCRWSIRNIAALIEKGVHFRLRDVLENGRKADWFTALTPFGKTPVLRHGDRIVVESRFINEYLDDVASGRALAPTDPGDRAWARVWSGHCDEELMKQVQTLVTGEPALHPQTLRRLDAALARLEAHLFEHAQPGVFWGGRLLALPDFAYWSLFDVLQRVDALDGARRLLQAYPRIAQWSRCLLGHPTFLQAEAQLGTLTPAP